MVDVKIKVLKGGHLPEYKKEGDVCLDCYARTSEPIVIKSGYRRLIPLGFVLELPEGWEAVVRPRSGLTLGMVDVKIGTIDVGFRGEVNACVSFCGKGSFIVKDGDRICQLAIREAPRVNFIEVDKLSETERGSNGFGSTGI